jgi:hypothetical protein
MAEVGVFISYAGEDRAWAEWIACSWRRPPSRPGSRPGTSTLAATLSIRWSRPCGTLSGWWRCCPRPYVTSQFGESEWRPVFRRDPSGELGLLVPVRVAECDPPELNEGEKSPLQRLCLRA